LIFGSDNGFFITSTGLISKEREINAIYLSIFLFVPEIDDIFIYRLMHISNNFRGERMLLLNAIVGLVQLIIAIIFSVIALYIGFITLAKITKNIDQEKELTKGNPAVGIIVAAVFVAIALVVQSGVSGLSVGINKAASVGLLSLDGLLAIGAALIQLILGIVLAIVAIYVALNTLDKLTKRVDEFEEIKKGNVAVALEMAGVIIAVAVVIQSGVLGITAAII
jgi:uncharacterized membrane protein YjfL (UPF0719 family)